MQLLIQINGSERQNLLEHINRNTHRRRKDGATVLLFNAFAMNENSRLTMPGRPFLFVVHLEGVGTKTNAIHNPFIVSNLRMHQP